MIYVCPPQPACTMRRIDQVHTVVFYPELWKPIPHYESLYEISNMGRVKSLASGRVLGYVKNNLGYLRAELYKKGERTRFMIHRLVARSFIGAVRGYTTKEVNHIDGDKLNNFVKNLEWMTKSQNNAHRHHTLGKNNFKKNESVEIDTQVVETDSWLDY